MSFKSADARSILDPLAKSFKSARTILHFPSRDGIITDAGAMSCTASMSFVHELNDEPHKGPIEQFFQRLVIQEHNLGRHMFNIILFLCLAYTATALPYRLAFLEFGMPETVPTEGRIIIVTEWFVDIFFIIDLFVSFFFSFKNERGKEILDIKPICCRYLKTYFLFNVLACVPPEAIGWIISTASGDESTQSSSVHKGVRMTRLQRMSRLFRLVRLLRLTKLINFVLNNSMVQHLTALRGVRILNFVAALLWVVHLTASFLFLVASLSPVHEETWVGVTAKADGIALLYKKPEEQWVYAMYFVLTIFTTVGFGDISANNVGESIALALAMMLGLVVNGIILSEVINVITTADQAAKDIISQKDLVNQFADHTGLHHKVKKRMIEWVSNSRTRVHSYDRKRMLHLISTGMPRSLQGKVPSAIFGGKLVRNKLFQMSPIPGLLPCVQIPYRFPLMVALSVQTRSFEPEEVVYHSWDHAWNVFVVMTGVFSGVVQPLKHGGLKELPQPSQSFVEETGDDDDDGGEAMYQDGEVHHPMKIMKTLKLPNNAVPYRFFGAGNYFGDIEVVQNSKMPRWFSVRCETAHRNPLATVLVLHKKEINHIAAEFPQAVRVWQLIAQQREKHYIKARANFRFPKDGKDFHDLAAAMIQRRVRSRQAGIQSVPTDQDDRTIRAASTDTSCDSGVTQSTQRPTLRSMPTGLRRRPEVASPERCKPENAEVNRNKEELQALRQEVGEIKVTMRTILRHLQSQDKGNSVCEARQSVRSDSPQQSIWL